MTRRVKDTLVRDRDRPQFDRVRDRRLLALLALVPGALLAAGLGALLTGAPSMTVLMLLGSHFVTQFIVLLVYGALLMNDEGLERAGRALWAFAFVSAAPVALPIYYAARVRSRPRREGRIVVQRITHRRGSGALAAA